jgi:citronellol/citronellal dehydrogenase
LLKFYINFYYFHFFLKKKDAKWFGPHVAYTMAKYGMSLCVLGMSEEFKDDKIAVNALWPRTSIATAAV